MRTITRIEGVYLGISPPSAGHDGVEITTEDHGVFYAVDYRVPQRVPETDVSLGRWQVFMRVDGETFDAGPCVCDGESLAEVLGALLRAGDLQCYCGGTGVVHSESGLSTCGGCGGAGCLEQSDAYRSFSSDEDD